MGNSACEFAALDTSGLSPVQHDCVRLLASPARRPQHMESTNWAAAALIHALAGFAGSMHIHPVSLISVPQPRGCAR
jgi:hypothetical protein